MLIKRVLLQNHRSFLHPTEIYFGPAMSIFVGPNGGGKSTLLDAVHGIIRSKLLGSFNARQFNTAETPYGFQYEKQDISSQHTIERHFESPPDFPQIIEIDIEATPRDVSNIELMKVDVSTLLELGSSRLQGFPYALCQSWNTNLVKSGNCFTFRFVNNQWTNPTSESHLLFQQYLQNFEVYSRARQELGLSELHLPMLYFASNRSTQNFSTSVQISGHDHFQYGSQINGANSRTSGLFADPSIQRIAMVFHKCVIKWGHSKALSHFHKDPNIAAITRHLKMLNYDWELQPINVDRAHYNFMLKKHDRNLAIQHTSSGEKQLLNFLLSIFGFNVRNALVLIDEPELHLHPLWQKSLYKLFEEMAEETQNQFIFATHSSVFISPKSIEHVTRIYTKNRESFIKRIRREELPKASNQIRMINSQNNEKVFFAEAVILVEGASDRIFWERIFLRFSKRTGLRKDIQFVDVGGKSELSKYVKVLNAYSIENAVIADLDYVEQIGTASLKALFKVDGKRLIVDTIASSKSRDGELLSSEIDRAVSTGEVNGLKMCWPEIRSRNLRSKEKIETKNNPELEVFVNDKKTERIFLLPKGDLEKYLPPLYTRKNLGALIDLTQSVKFEATMGKSRLSVADKFLNDVISSLN